MEKYQTNGSKELYEKAQRFLLNGMASYFHKSDSEEYPICMSRGKGSKLYDVDGNEYIDYVGGLGPMLLGYSPESVFAEIDEQLERGSHFSATTPQLCALSRKLTEIIPCAEVVSYQNSGTEGDMFAIRAARAYTGKLKVIKFESTYHGWSDELKVSVDTDDEACFGDRENPIRYITTKGQRVAASDDVIVLPFNDIHLIHTVLRKQGDEIAAIIMEPMICDSGPIPPLPGFLQEVVDTAHKYGVVVIFDEVITGFRFALGGAQEYFGVTPDMAVFAKAVTGGLPLAVIGGKREIMECGVISSGTFNANPIVVAAALGAIKVYEEPGVYERLQELGDRLATGLVEVGKKHGILMYAKAYGGLISWTVGMDRPPIDFRDWLHNADIGLYDQIFLRSRDYGVRWTERRGRINLSTEHTEQDIEITLAVLDQVLSDMEEEAGK